MRRKLLSVALCVCMMFTMVPFAFAANTTVDSYQALQTALESASNGDTITLSNDIIFTPTQGQSGHLNPQICIGESVTLNLNNHKIAYDSNCMSTSYTGTPTLLSIMNGATVTIIGNGTIDAELGNNGSYAINVTDDSQLIIENGNFYGAPTAVQIQKGSFIAYNGNFNLASTISNIQNSATAYAKYIVNCIDAAFKDGTAKVQLIGGTYGYDFSNKPEGEGTTYIPSGYNVTESNGSYFISEKSDNVAQINGVQYATLPDAVEAAGNKTVTLLKDVSEDLVIPADKTVTLNLNGKKLTNVSSNTITNNGTLTITGEGTVDNVTHAKAAIYNKGTVTLNGGTYDRSNEDGVDADNAGTNTYYTILNHGKMTVDSSVTVRNKGHHSSLFENGYYSQNSKDGIDNPTLTITSGTYEGGLNTIKNDDDATLTINGGTFTNYTQAAFQNHGTATVTAGSFIANSKYAIDNCGCDATHDPGKLEIFGGTFNGTLYIRSAYSNVTISDGYFNGSISKTDGTLTITGGYFTTDPSAYCVDGKTGIPSTEPGYAFTVGEKAGNEVKPATAAPDVNIPENSNITNENDKTAATTIGQSVQDTTGVLSAAANQAISNVTEAQKTDAENAIRAANSGVTVNAVDTVNIYAQTYLKITPTAYEDNRFTLDIQPMYRVVASTKGDGKNFIFPATDVNNANAIVLTGSEKPLTNIQTMEISLELPDSFATADGTGYKPVYVQHKGHEYIAAVTDKQISSQDATTTTKQVATFTNPDGFSEFTISKDPVAVATIGQNRYTTLQDAVDAVKDNETINVTGDNLSATVSGNKTFSVTGKTVTLTAASGYNLTENGNTYTVSHQSSGGPGSSGGSISTPTTYAVNVNAATNGAVAADKKTASKGTTVTVTASPSKGYVVDAVKVVDKDGKDVAVTGKDGKYVFTMPGSAVTVTGTFKAETPVSLPFTDVKSGDWFYPAVQYAYAQGLMTGTSATTFAPNGTMNRAMIVTVLYRLEKSPAVTGASKFTDVPAGQWYSDAVAWAAANKIVNGYDETTFGPMNAVTREQMAAILFRYEQVKGLENVTLEENLNRFPDQNKISAYAIPALQWAVGQKIINGNADGTLDPTGTATRAQVAQIFTNLLNQ